MLETLDGGQGRQELGSAPGHQKLGHDVHQDCVALLNVMESSTLVLHQRGRSLLIKCGPQVATACRDWYSLVGVVVPNTEMLISRPFAGLYKIRLLLRDCMRTKNVRN